MQKAVVSLRGPRGSSQWLSPFELDIEDSSRRSPGRTMRKAVWSHLTKVLQVQDTWVRVSISAIWGKEALLSRA